MRWSDGLLFLAILLTGCSNQEPISNECQQKMTGYLYVTEDKQYITPKNEEARYILNEDAIPPPIKKGDEVTVTYTSILETYPLRLNVCDIKAR